MNIPDKAVESAAEVIRNAHPFQSLSGCRAEARAALEAAAPHLLAEAWEEGHVRGFWNGRLSELTVPYDAPDPLIGKQDAEANNPYRSQA